MERAVVGHSVWREIAPEITPSDFREPHRMNVGTLRRLSRVRRRAGVPFRIVSDHRPPERNAAAGGATGSAHMGDPCCAVDLRVQSAAERFAVVAAALAEGFVRIGVYPPTESQRVQWGKNSGSVHLDDSPLHASRVMWVSV
jgi:hypothetical protein